MKSVIINRRINDIGIPERLFSLLPYRIKDVIQERECEISKTCEEIRLRVGRASTLTLSGGEIYYLGTSLSQDEMDETVERLCAGSLYAHSDTIKNGYISLFGGIRVGVCGRAAIDNGKVLGIGEISSLCIRIPHSVKVDPTPIVDLLTQFSYSKGVLIYSPPGEGKTTLLRSVAERLSQIHNKESLSRVAVVDSRGELGRGLSRDSSADVLVGYPKSLGIEIALRTLNASVIICDEIGNEDEARSILDVSNGGAALIASAHAADLSSLLNKKSIKLLDDAGVFGAYVGIKRSGGEFTYTVNERGEKMCFPRL